MGTLSSYRTAFQSADGWGRPFLYSNSRDGQHYTMMSGGSNATVEFTGVPYWPHELGAESHAVDVIIRNGEWFSYYRGKTGYERVTVDEVLLEQLKEGKMQTQ
jgi:hypothetical protein